MKPRRNAEGESFSESRKRFEEEVFRLLETARFDTWAKQRRELESKDKHLESALPRLSGESTDWMEPDIFDLLEKRELPNGHLLLKGCGFEIKFESKEHVIEAIRDVARRHCFKLGKQALNWRSDNFQRFACETAAVAA